MIARAAVVSARSSLAARPRGGLVNVRPLVSQKTRHRGGENTEDFSNASRMAIEHDHAFAPIEHEERASSRSNPIRSIRPDPIRREATQNPSVSSPPLWRVSDPIRSIRQAPIRREVQQGTGPGFSSCHLPHRRTNRVRGGHRLPMTSDPKPREAMAPTRSNPSRSDKKISSWGLGVLAVTPNGVLAVTPNAVTPKAVTPNGALAVRHAAGGRA